MRLQQQVAIVTGGGSGIGEACAKRLSGMGWRVFAGVFDEAQRAHVEQSRLARVTPVLLDITKADQIAAAAHAMAAEVGERGLSGLVNNAGIGVMGPLEYVPIDRLRPIQGSSFHGVEIGKDVKLPFAFVRSPDAKYWEYDKRAKKFRSKPHLHRRSKKFGIVKFRDDIGGSKFVLREQGR